MRCASNFSCSKMRANWSQTRSWQLRQWSSFSWQACMITWWWYVLFFIVIIQACQEQDDHCLNWEHNIFLLRTSHSHVCFSHMPEALGDCLLKLHLYNWQTNSDASSPMVPHTSTPVNSCKVNGHPVTYEDASLPSGTWENSPVHPDNWVASVILANDKEKILVV